jgi:hypothetical protein
MKHLALIPLLLLAACQTVPVEDIPRFAIVPGATHDGLWRGGQPSVIAWRQAVNAGIRHSVKLNLEAENAPASIEVLAFPMNLGMQLGEGPSQAMLIQIVNAIRPDTLVHCEHGQDRTGLVIACYRVLVDGWTCADAEQEMIAHDFHKSLHGLWEAWERFKQDHK